MRKYGTFSAEELRKEEQARNPKHPEQIIYLSQDDENTLIYMDEGCHKVGCRTVAAWAEKSTGKIVRDCFYVKPEELEYYCIDGRMHVKPEEEDKILAYVNQIKPNYAYSNSYVAYCFRRNA